MKATTSTISDCETGTRSRAAIISDLVKARLSSLVLLTTLVGFYMGSGDVFSWGLLGNLMIGTALLAGGAGALNQLIERRLDAEMERTKNRPLPTGLVSADFVLVFGGATAAIGILWLALLVNPLTSLLGAATLVSYLFLYTPSKRVTSLNTIIGAVPGAIPPLMGWTAARGELSLEGWYLFAVLFFWQLPHFMAIAWIYREQYAKAGFKMLPVVDETGVRTGRSALSHTLGLVPVSFFPVAIQVCGPIYFVGALLLGIGFLAFAWRFSRSLTLASARLLFFYSIIYLPLLLGLMVIDKI